MTTSKRWFGYVLVCDGCCIDIKHVKDFTPCGVIDNVASEPMYSSEAEALEAGLKAESFFSNHTYRVFTYEMK
jgi:hypothetical protein